MSNLILFDIDGTLRDEIKGIPPSTCTAITHLRQHHHLCICTGRNLSSIQEDVKQLDMHHLIAGGGSYIQVYDQVIQDTSFSKDTINSLLQFLYQHSSIGISLESNHQLYMNALGASILQEMNHMKTEHLSNEQRQYIQQTQRITYQETLQHLSIDQDPIHKICLWCQPTQFLEIQAMIQTAHMQLAQSGKWKQYTYYEIICKHANKGEALLRLCEYLGIALTDTIAFGDGKNDIDLFQTCPVSIAMGNAVKELLPYANAQCEDVNNDGIYKELKRRNLLYEEKTI